MKDTSEQKPSADSANAASLRDQQAFIREILDSLPHPLYVIDAKTYAVERANAKAIASGRPAFCQALLQDASIGPVDPPRASLLIEEVKRTKTRLVLEHVEYAHSCLASIYEIHLCPVLDENDNVKWVIECALDITSRTRTRQALQESESRLRQVIESLPVVLVSQDSAGKPSLVSGAVQEILGYAANDLLGNPELLMRIVHPEDVAVARQLMRQCISRNHPFEMDLRVEHGTRHKTVWVHAKAVPILDEDGNLERVDSILVDKTEERRVAHEREQLETHLQQMQRLESLGVLAGGIAHDFNNLLTVIGGNAQFLRETVTLEAAQAKALADVETATRTAGDMVRSLQAFSRPSKPQIAIFDANLMAQDVYRFLRRLMPARLDFQFHPHPVACLVAADSGQLQQVLTNLCLNARDAQPSHIELVTSLVPAIQLPLAVRVQADQPAYVEIAVNDDGRGMDEQTLHRAFDPFFTTKSKDQGTGLGLAIVYRIVQGHGGMIDAISTPGQGSRFRIFLPQAEPPADGPDRDAARATGTEHVLVIDDEPMIASLLGTILESAGYHVAIAHHPDQAVALAANPDVHIDLAIIDYNLPGMSGLDCLTALRRRWPDLECVMISGHPVSETELQSARVCLLTKPFSSQVIALTVRQVLDGRIDSGQSRLL